ncbi:14602_t:CDS:2, partial [Racocetra fulgida]
MDANSVSLDVTANSELNASNSCSDLKVEVVEPVASSVSISITELNVENNTETNNSDKKVVTDLEDDKIEIIKPTTNSISNVVDNIETGYSDTEDYNNSLEKLIQMIYSNEDTPPTKLECMNLIMPELTEEVSEKFLGKLFELENINPEEIVYSAFPCKRNIWERKNKRHFPIIKYKFNLSLSRIRKLGLEIESTKHFNQHLIIKGQTVKILSYDLPTEQFILVYQYNRLARLYGIQTVGLEIMKSYLFLLNDSESRDIIVKRNIWMPNDAMKTRTVFIKNWTK